MIKHIRLSEADLALCERYAKDIQARHKNTDQSKNVDVRADRFNRDYTAKAAEVAVARHLGIMPSFTVNQGQGGDGGFDLKHTLKDGTVITIDAKHSTNKNAECLIWPKTSSFDRMADVLVFVTGAQINTVEFGSFWLHGWITGRQFIKLHQIAGHDHTLKEGTPFMYCSSLVPVEYLQ